MQELTIEHLAPYLPYGLDVIAYDEKDGFKEKYKLNCAYMEAIIHAPMSWVKYYPVLRPLFQLTEEIEHDGERFVPKERLRGASANDWSDLKHWNFWMVQKLFKWHFDVFGLIESGLAIEK